MKRRDFIAPIRTPLTPEQQERINAAMAKKSDEYFVTQITACCQRGVENILTAGRLLIEAKTKLLPGTFQEMIKTKLPFSPRTAQMLMCIAEHPVISNANHGSHLPPSWRTLYELTKIPHKMLSPKLRTAPSAPISNERTWPSSKVNAVSAEISSVRR
jgi:hypothetical protein